LLSLQPLPVSDIAPAQLPNVALIQAMDQERAA
jgi:hypothetical protein